MLAGGPARVSMLLRPGRSIFGTSHPHRRRAKNGGTWYVKCLRATNSLIFAERHAAVPQVRYAAERMKKTILASLTQRNTRQRGREGSKRLSTAALSFWFAHCIHTPPAIRSGRQPRHSSKTSPSSSRASAGSSHAPSDLPICSGEANPTNVIESSEKEAHVKKQALDRRFRTCGTRSRPGGRTKDTGARQS